MSLHPLPMLPLDAQGYPRHHQIAMDAAAQELADWVNELPESFYHFGLADARDVLQIAMARYWLVIRRQP